MSDASRRSRDWSLEGDGIEVADGEALPADAHLASVEVDDGPRPTGLCVLLFLRLFPLVAAAAFAAPPEPSGFASREILKTRTTWDGAPIVGSGAATPEVKALVGEIAPWLRSARIREFLCEAISVDPGRPR